MASTASQGPIDKSAKRIFRSYFRGRWQNMQNIVSNYAFFANMPAKWLTYANTYIRQWDEWSRGFVIAVHKGDMFSVGMGYTVCEILTRECVKGRYRFDGDIIAFNDFVTKWAEDTNFSETVFEGFLNANRLGNNILRLNVLAGSGELYATSHGSDRVYFECNRKGNLRRARFVDRIDSNTVDNRQYFAVEDRAFFQNKPYYKITIHEGSGTVLSDTFSASAIKFENLDSQVRELFEELYGNIVPGQWYSLPFKTLGCYNWKNKPTSVAVNDLRGYSDSSIHTAIDVLYSIDYNWTNGQLDNYFGKTRVLTPNQMKAVSVGGGRRVAEGREYSELMEEDAPLDDEIYTKLPRTSNEEQAPLFIQPDLRGEARKYIRDADLELLASKVGLSSSTLANHLTYNNSKTATEVEENRDTTDVTVTFKRELADKAINMLLKDLLDYYGINGKVNITWNQTGQNSAKHKEAIRQEYLDGVMPIEECIKRLHPELTKEEIDEWVRKIEASKTTTDLFGGM